MGRLRPDDGEHLCPRQIHSISRSQGIFWLSQNGSALLTLASHTRIPELPHCPSSQTPTLFSMSSDALSVLGSSQARGWQRCVQTSHLILHHASPPSSSHQQIQLTNLMLQLQKAKQLWKIDQVPWNSLTQRGLRSLQADSRVGWRQNSTGKCLPTQAVQENPLGALKSTAPPPNANTLADSVALGCDLGIRIFKSPHII